MAEARRVSSSFDQKTLDRVEAIRADREPLPDLPELISLVQQMGGDRRPEVALALLQKIPREKLKDVAAPEPKQIRFLAAWFELHRSGIDPNVRVANSLLALRPAGAPEPAIEEIVNLADQLAGARRFAEASRVLEGIKSETPEQDSLLRKKKAAFLYRNESLGQDSRASAAHDLVRPLVEMSPGESGPKEEDFRRVRIHLLLAGQLKDSRAFGLARVELVAARKLLEALDPASLSPENTTEVCAHYRKATQQLALCTYKDPDLPVKKKFVESLQYLDEMAWREWKEPLASTKNAETLGLAGAIHKRLWEATGQKRNLEAALEYYRRGYEIAGTTGDGYTPTNTAYTLLVLESLSPGRELRVLVNGQSLSTRDIWSKIAEDLGARWAKKDDEKEVGSPKTKWWFLVTLGGALLGLGRFKEAANVLDHAREIRETPQWEFETTARQLVDQLRLQMGSSKTLAEVLASEGGQVLEKFLDGKTQGIQSAFIGKVGLALSGGGFRASLYHIGVLARLAELDVLRHVEVLSCVSGGSIVGAHYYLLLRKLLMTKGENKITRDDFIQVVAELEKQFLEGVRTNIRTRVASNLLTNVLMMVCPGYSRTTRVGELYEEELYKRAFEKKLAPKEIFLDDILIHPVDEMPSFAPKNDNWRRKVKVPALVLNATTLNTGHNWQFTASFMGEPPGDLETGVDSNYRLRRMYYDEAPEKYRRVRLGTAVAASSCVPGLFEPIAMRGLYQDKIVRLVDGGVHDNQGIASLVEQDCTVLLVSDASGQMESDNNPGRGVLAVPLRSNDVMMARIRESEYEDMEARRSSGLLKGLLFIHLKKGLQVEEVTWISRKKPNKTRAEKPDDTSPYGIRKDVLRKLAAIRTDLDSFCDVEADALMRAGYLMVDQDFRTAVPHLPVTTGKYPSWRFHGGLTRQSEADFQKILHEARRNALKVWFLSPILTGLGVVLIVAAAAGAFLACRRWSSLSLVTLGSLGWAVTGLAAGYLVTSGLGKLIVNMIRFRDLVARFLGGLAMCVIGCLVAFVHLKVFDRLYLFLGRRR